MVEGPQASVIAAAILFCVYIGMMAMSVWLISWKYFAAIIAVLSASMGLLMWSDGKVVAILGMLCVYFVFLYSIYYKFIMGDRALDKVRPALLVQKSREEKLTMAWFFIYLPNVVYYAIIILGVYIYLFVGYGQ